MGVVTRMAPIAVAIAMALGAPSVALGDKGQLAAGKRLYRQVEYRRAITTLNRALANNLTRAEQIDTTLLQAALHKPPSPSHVPPHPHQIRA